MKHVSLLFENTHSKIHTEIEKAEFRASNVRLRLFEFSVNIRNFVAKIPKKLWNEKVSGNEFSKEFQPDRLKISPDLTVYNREEYSNGHEHLVNNSEKYNKLTQKHGSKRLHLPVYK